MKRLLTYLIPLVMLLAPSASLRAQMLGAEDISEVYALVRYFKTHIPLADTAAHLTITHVYLNTDYRYVKLTVILDKGQTIDNPDHYLHYFTHDSRWSLQPLADHAFDLRLNVQANKTPAGAAYNYTTLDLQNALNPPDELRARQYLQGFAYSVSQTLPIPLSEGEVFSQCYYDTQRQMLTACYDYTTDQWDYVANLVRSSTESVRSELMETLLADTSAQLVMAAYVGDVTFRYLYRNHDHTDSAEVFVSPWMWEPLIESRPDDNDTLGVLQYIAHSVTAECPVQVDTATTLLRCELDTVARTLTYYYDVQELSMLNLEHSGQTAVDYLNQAIEAALRSDNGQTLATYLIGGNFNLAYHYSSARSARPVVITLTPENLRAIIAKTE